MMLIENSGMEKKRMRMMVIENSGMEIKKRMKMMLIENSGIETKKRMMIMLTENSGMEIQKIIKDGDNAVEIYQKEEMKEMTTWMEVEGIKKQENKQKVGK